jgi:hypothetical protein
VADAQSVALDAEQKFLDNFAANEEGVSTLVKRKMTSSEDRNTYMESRKKHIDDTDRDVRMKDMGAVCPWIPQFTPQAEVTRVKKPPKRPPSPMTSRPLKTSDLIPIDLLREDGSTSSDEVKASEGSVKFICPVSRYFEHVAMIGMCSPLCFCSISYSDAPSSIYPTLTNVVLEKQL